MICSVCPSWFPRRAVIEQTTPENITGFFTKFGDGVLIFSLLRLNKRQEDNSCRTWQIQPFMKNPNGRPRRRQTRLADEVALGVTYEEIDELPGRKTISPEAQTRIETGDKGQHKRHLPITVFDDF